MNVLISVNIKWLMLKIADPCEKYMACYAVRGLSGTSGYTMGLLEESEQLMTLE